MICWFDVLFIDFDITSSVLNWRFKLLDEARRENVFAKENAFVRTLLKRFNEMNSNWILNYSNAWSHKHFDKKFSKSDLRYWCQNCWKCCKKFATSLYSSNFDSLHVVESKISIFWNVNVDLTVCSVLEVFLNSFRLTTFEVSDVIFNFCCFCEEDEINETNDFDEMRIDCIITDLLEENVFVRTISKSCNEMNFDWSSNHALTKSARTIINKLSSFDSQYRCKHCWRCWRKSAIWLNSSSSNQS